MKKLLGAVVMLFFCHAAFGAAPTNNSCVAFPDPQPLPNKARTVLILKVLGATSGGYYIQTYDGQNMWSRVIYSGDVFTKEQIDNADRIECPLERAAR